MHPVMDNNQHDVGIRQRLKDHDHGR